MSNGSRLAALLLISEIEKGYVNHPDDPGKATKYGITQATLTAYRGHAVSEDDVRKLAVDEAVAIYNKHYWLPVHGDDLPWPTAFLLFDAAVNIGIYPTTLLAQKALAIKQDGAFGPVTLAMAKRANERTFRRAFLERRIRHYMGLPGWPTFGVGWLNRLIIATEIACGGSGQPAPIIGA